MLNLIQNEWMKIWQKKSNWITVIIFAALIAGVSGLIKYMDVALNDEASIGPHKEEIASLEEQLAEPGLSESEHERLSEELQFEEEMLEYAIESTVPTPREDIMIGTYTSMSLVTLLTIIIASSIVSTEFAQGTIKMLLSRPVKRWKILCAKYLTVVLYSLLLTVILFVVTYLSAMLLFETGDSIDYFGREIASSAVLGKSLYLVFLGWINTIIISTLAFMIGTIFRSTSLAIGISMFLYFTGNAIVFFLEKYKFAKYILFTNTDLTQYETGHELIEGLSMSFSATVLAVYAVLFLFLSFFAFIKRDVAA